VYHSDKIENVPEVNVDTENNCLNTVIYNVYVTASLLTISAYSLPLLKFMLKAIQLSLIQTQSQCLIIFLFEFFNI